MGAANDNGDTEDECADQHGHEGPEAPYISTRASKEPGSADTGLEGAARLGSRLLAPGAGLLVHELVVAPHVEEDRLCAVDTVHLNRRDQRCSIPIGTTYNISGGERRCSVLANSGLALSGQFQEGLGLLVQSIGKVLARSLWEMWRE